MFLSFYLLMLFCIDSDGCVFDNMRWKHENAFLSALLDVFELHDQKDLTKKLWLEINLYSETRGTNRFSAIANFLNRTWKDRRNGTPHVLPGNPEDFVKFVQNPANCNAESIRRRLAKNDNEPYFDRVLRWHAEVNRRIKESGVIPEPFSGAKEALQLMAKIGEVHIVSLSPKSLLIAEWSKAGLMPYVTEILGQECGSKSKQVWHAKRGRDINTLLVGDAPGDERAAILANCAFFPTIPSRETESWKELHRLLSSSHAKRSPLDPALLRRQVDAFHHSLGF